MLLKKRTRDHHFLTPFLLYFFCVIGPNQSEAQFLGPDSKVLGTAGMHTENSSCWA